MNLVIDIGNTQLKVALFDGQRLVEHKVYKTVKQFVSDHAFIANSDSAILSSVVSSNSEILNSISGFKHVIEFSSQTPVPVNNLYKSAQTLGSDRLAAAVGAFSIYPFKNILVIDAGTCIKFNFTNKNNEYLGGAISPGIQMRLKALEHFTDKLPLVKFNPEFDKLIGNTTEESILSGVVNGVLKETDGIIEEYKKLYPDLTIVVTGGDCDFFAKRLKNRIFAHPHLILNGLNEILIYNT